MVKTVFITGASTGIGRATAERFFEEGWQVVATMRSPQNRREDARWLETALDVNDPASVAQAVSFAVERCGRIDALVNNAGYSLVGTFESMSEAQIARQFETNVFGLMRVTRALLPHLREMQGGSVINVASMGGRLAFPFYSVYHATKWAVEGFSESLAYELAPLGLRVRIIEPGAIRTDFYGRSTEFVHDRLLTAYNGLVDRGMRGISKAAVKGAAPEKVADVIWKAANDSSDRLRYVVGKDARALLAARHLMSPQAMRKLVTAQLLR